VVVVTTTLSVAVILLPPVIVKLHVPAATGVTENAALPVLAIVAIPLQVVVDAVKVPV
jgi:hypothetical protein